MASTTARRTSVAIAGMAGLAFAVATAGTAIAISGGGYSTHKQGCSKRADSNNREERKQPHGCHDSQLLVKDGKGHTYVEAGTGTSSEGNNVHAANVVVSPDGSASPKGTASGTAIQSRVDTHYQPIPEDQCGLFDLLVYPVSVATGSACKLDPTAWKLPSKLPKVTKGISVGKHAAVVPDASSLAVYFGADDGLDTGEHDEPDGKHGTKDSQTGPSDGGALTARWHPNAAKTWLPLVMAGVKKGHISKLATNPVPFFSVGGGACADGICFAGQSKRETAYRGGGKGGKRRDAYDYDGKTFDPYNCSGESSEAETKCHDKHHKNEDSYYRAEARHVYLEPGLQIYEDPDPSGSPAAPTYPLPGVYVGSCGVTVGGGAVKVPKSPLTNHSGQLMVKPTHC